MCSDITQSNAIINGYYYHLSKIVFEIANKRKDIMPKLKFVCFSIIELLTVVLIILLLISLTFPIFISLKKNAKSSICKNQLRQIGVLFTSNISDDDGYLPKEVFFGDGAVETKGQVYPSINRKFVGNQSNERNLDS